MSASKFPLLDRRGRRERLFLIASGGVVDKLMLAQRSLLLRCLIYHPVCASKEGGLFLYGAATPPVQEGKFAGRHIFLTGGWQTVAATRLRQFIHTFSGRREQHIDDLFHDIRYALRECRRKPTFALTATLPIRWHWRQHCHVQLCGYVSVAAASLSSTGTGSAVIEEATLNRTSEAERIVSEPQRLEGAESKL